MKFEWDDAKRKINIRKHGIDFLDVIRVFDGQTISFEDERFKYDEQRFITIGLSVTRLSLLYIHLSELIRYV